MNDPIIECALARRLSGDVPPPARLAAHHRDVGRHMAAIEQRHPEMTGRIVRIILGLRLEHAAAYAHALEIDELFGKYRKARWRRAVWTGVEALAERNRELVVDPALRRIPLPGIAVLGRDLGVRGHMRKILQPPRIGFADRHKSDNRCRMTDDRKTQSKSAVRHLLSVL